MNTTTRRRPLPLFSIRLAGAMICGLAVGGIRASTLDTIGATLLQVVTTNLNGLAVGVVQAEAGAPTWEVDPAAVGQPDVLFTYYATAGSTNIYPNTLGSASDHAATVGALIYGMPAGVATNVGHVDNYEAQYFYDSVVTQLTPVSATIVNQSFSFGPSSLAMQQALDSAYDSYAARYHALFVSGAGNSGTVAPPATCYNGIGVAAYGGTSSVGPTPDNARAKPDLTAPGGVTSFSTPLVTGAAILLQQAGARGDGGSDTNSAMDVRTLKALLLNGAVKPADWAALNGSPLDSRYGAGVLNLFNSYQHLAGGKHGYNDSSVVPVGGVHPPSQVTASVSALSGWDWNTGASSPAADGVNHYCFDVTNSTAASFTATVTLVWERQQNQSAINNLDLFLYEARSGRLMAASTSAVDNVEHLWVPALPLGRYDLQVWKAGGGNRQQRVSNTETYALAFDFFTVSLRIGRSGTNAILTWPIYPAGFSLQSALGLGTPAGWTGVNGIPVVSNGQNRLIVEGAPGNQFFRLRRP